MATETDRLSELKCRDCLHYKLTGWWDPQKVCDLDGWPIDPNGSACISPQKVCDLDGWPIDPNGSACISVQPKTKPRTP